MISRHLLSRASKYLVQALFVLVPTSASAMQPLATFLEQAHSESFDAREQGVVARQRALEGEAALGKLLPSLSVRGVYTRNQDETSVRVPGAAEPLVITPQNQFDAIFQVDVPVLDLAAYHRYQQAQYLAGAAELQRALIGAQLDQAVTRFYYAFVGSSALVQASERSLAIAKENLQFIATRYQLGVASELDQERARANVERARQERTDAEFVRLTAGRGLETLTGMTPAAVTTYPVDDLHSESPLPTWLSVDETPELRVQAAFAAAARAGKKAANSGFLPVLSANAQERITNATGFSGRADSYTLQAVLSWRLDYASYKTAQAQAVASEGQQLRSQRVRRTVEDAIFDAYHRVKSGIAKSASARAQAESSRKAEALALERYKAGTLTQLDVTQSQRDAFQAETARIQADADLAYARALLRIVSGKPLALKHSAPTGRAAKSSQPSSLHD